MALNANALIEDILDEGKNLQKDIIEQLSKVALTMPGMVDKNGKPAGETFPFVPTEQGQMMEFGDSNKEKASVDEKYTGIEAIVEIMVENIVRVSIPEILKHITDNLEITVPTNSVITKVSGGTLNVSPIECKQE